MKILTQIVLVLTSYIMFTVLICAAAIDLGLIMTVWDKVPTGWNLRLSAWNSLLIINMVGTTLWAGTGLHYMLFGRLRT